MDRRIYPGRRFFDCCRIPERRFADRRLSDATGISGAFKCTRDVRLHSVSLPAVKNSMCCPDSTGFQVQVALQ